MALVKVKILGNPEVKEYSVDSIGELKSELGLEGYSATVNGSAQDDSYAPQDAQLITFSKAVKGGKK